MPLTCVLFAAGLDWLENLLPVLFVGFWILSQVFAVFRRAAGNGRPAEPPVVRRPEPVRPVAPHMPAEGREQLEQQIEEFLRRVNREPAPKPAPKPTPQPRAPQPTPAAAKPAPVAKPAPIATDVASHVREAFAHDLKHDRPSLAKPATVRRADESARATPPVATTHRAKIAAELAQALRNPASIRQAILLREVLERPADRW
ncbi:MAG: hypothetical protein ACK48M_07565 [Planctomycetia bacterium]